MQSGNEDFSRGDPTLQHASQAAAHWLATLSDENCSDAERRQFFEWLRSSTRHVDEFLSLSRLTRSASNRALWPNDSIEELVAAARASANVATLDAASTADTSSKRRHRFQTWAIAASVACVVAVGAALLVNAEFLRGNYSTQVGEQRSVTLEDGSVVELNSRSKMRTRFTPTLRAVELTEGEAIFRVAKDANRPFRVRTGATDIVAVGTAFNVNANESRTIVTVLEGRVRVDNRAEPVSTSASQTAGAAAHIELAVGEQVIVAPSRPIIRVALQDMEKVTSWTERRLIFEDTTIADAAAEFARYSPRTIRVEDSNLSARKITGVFDATDPASLVEFLAADESLVVESSGEGWIVRGRNPVRENRD